MSPGTRRAVVRASLVLALALSTASQDASSCQYPPYPPPPPPAATCDLNAELVPELAVVRAGEPFRVVFSITNSGTPVRGYPPPFQNDRIFDIVATGCVDTDGDGTCESGTLGCPDMNGEPRQRGAPSDPVDPVRFVLLDDAWAPSTDDPTSAVEIFTFVPRGVAETYTVSVKATVSDGIGNVVECTRLACIEAVIDPPSGPTPSATFVDPALHGEGGGVLPFALRVSRNGYPADRPLTVKVTPENPYDPRDIFPLEPPTITTIGQTVTGDEELVTFACNLHYPCFVGAYNAYHVSISDGPVELWNTQWQETPAGRAWVDASPMAHLELVGIERAGCGGRLSSCEGGLLHLRLFARNPFYGITLDSAALELPLPSGLSVASHSLHFHDNPMDDDVPTPAELAADGIVTIQPDLFRVDIGTIEPRFEGAPVAPRVFLDLFEVELYLDVPAGRLAGVSELAFPALTVTGVASGLMQRGVAEVLVVPVGQSLPDETSPGTGDRTLRFPGGHDLFTWGACADSWADAFDVYRGDLEVLRMGRPAVVGNCLASGLTDNQLADPERPGTGHAFTYLVGGVNCHGKGTLGLGSTGTLRVTAEDCP